MKTITINVEDDFFDKVTGEMVIRTILIMGADKKALYTPVIHFVATVLRGILEDKPEITITGDPDKDCEDCPDGSV